MTDFCFCGLPLDNKKQCKRHKDKIVKQEKVKRGRFSGKSKSENAFGKY